MQNTITCKTLLGQRGLDFSIACLESFINNSEDTILLQIFEDGSITDVDEKRLLAALPGSSIVRKNVRNPIIEERLKKYPNCKKFRDENVLAQKLFDIMLYNNEDLLFIDSDIFFLKKYKLPSFNHVPTVIRDTQNALSFAPGNFFKIKYPVFPQINTGLIYFPFEAYNLDFIESLLQDPIFIKDFIVYKVWAEQTLWATLISLGKQVNYFNNDQIIMAVEKTVVTDKTVAVHLVSSYRNQFEKVKSFKSVKSKSYTSITLKSTNRSLNNIAFLVERMVKKSKAYYNKQ